MPIRIAIYRELPHILLRNYVSTHPHLYNLHTPTTYGLWPHQPPSPSEPTSPKKASRYRLLANLLSWLDRHLSSPLPPRPALETHHPIDSQQTPRCNNPLLLHRNKHTLPSPGEDEEAPPSTPNNASSSTSMAAAASSAATRLMTRGGSALY